MRKGLIYLENKQIFGILSGSNAYAFKHNIANTSFCLQNNHNPVFRSGRNGDISACRALLFYNRLYIFVGHNDGCDKAHGRKKRCK